MPLVETDTLTKQFEPRVRRRRPCEFLRRREARKRAAKPIIALDGVSLTIEAGECYGLLWDPMAPAIPCALARADRGDGDELGILQHGELRLVVLSGLKSDGAPPKPRSLAAVLNAQAFARC